VLDLVPEEFRHLTLFPVGRLDKDTSGLLLLTNDGEFAHKVISPKYEIPKRYYAETEGVPDARDAEAFARGIELRDGFLCRSAELFPSGGGSCEVIVKEGKYHQVRRMLAAVGKPVTALRRLSIGALELENLPLKEGFCELSREQLELIFIK
jgi:16S rRNA pseudouridine516 synthase